MVAILRDAFEQMVNEIENYTKFLTVNPKYGVDFDTLIPENPFPNYPEVGYNLDEHPSYARFDSSRKTAVIDFLYRTHTLNLQIVPQIFHLHFITDSAEIFVEASPSLGVAFIDYDLEHETPDSEQSTEEEINGLAEIMKKAKFDVRFAEPDWKKIEDENRQKEPISLSYLFS